MRNQAFSQGKDRVGGVLKSYFTILDKQGSWAMQALSSPS